MLFRSAPRSGAHLTNNTPTIKLKVADNIGVDAVFISVNSTVDFAPATPNGGFWESDVTLPSGINVLRAYAVDISGNVSRLATSKVTAP